MKALRLFKALSMVDEKWVEEAWDYQPPVRKRPPALYGLAAAACCTLFCAFGFFYLVTGGFHGFGSAAPVTPGQEYVSAALLRSGDPLLPDYFDRLIPSLERTVEGLRRGSEPERLHYYETALRELRKMREHYDNGC